MTAGRITTTVDTTVSPGLGAYSQHITITTTGAILPTASGAAAVYDTPDVTSISLLNQGQIAGSAGGYGGQGALLSPGGVGVDLNAGKLSNDGAISGGAGFDTYKAGTLGGTGVIIAGGSLANSGTVIGGIGGHSTGEYYGNGVRGGDGIDLSAGSLTNLTGITGGNGGNGGRYTSGGNGGDGVSITGQSILHNSGDISGGAGGFGGGAGVGLNYGLKYAGDGGDGVDLQASKLTNSGNISGGAGGNGYAYGGQGGNGVSIYRGQLINNGQITGGIGGNDIIYGAAGGNGGNGVYIDGGKLVNAGTISGAAGGTSVGIKANGSAGDAVKFGNMSATLILLPGAVFNGQVAANPSADDVLDLSGKAAGSLTGLGSQFTGFTSMVVAEGANWTLAGVAETAPAALKDNGTLAVSGTLTLGEIAAGAGTLGIEASSVVIAPGTLGIASVAFDGPSGTLMLANPAGFTSAITGFGTGDQIDLQGLITTSSQYANGELTLYDHTAMVDQITFTGSYSVTNFGIQSDGNNGTLITFVPA